MNFPEVEEWVRANLPSQPARVLEVGAGEGELARSLRTSGYEMTAIDPKSEVADVEPVALADLPLPERSFDAAIAVESQVAGGLGAGSSEPIAVFRHLRIAASTALESPAVALRGSI